MPYPAYANYPRRRVSALVTHAQPRPSTPQGAQWGDVRQWAGQVVEKIRVASATGRVRFLPWYDPYTDETPEIRGEYRKMLTESSVKAAFQTKILSVISLDVQCQAADDDDPRQQQASQFLTYAFRKVKGGMRRVGWSVLHPAVIDGHSVCEKVWRPEVEASGPWRGKRIYEAVKAKDTKFIQLGIDPFRNVTGVRGMAFNAGRIWSPEDFVIFSYLELFENPAGTSDFRAAYRPYWIKNTVWQLRSLHLDKYVGPYLKGQYTTQDQKDALEAALQEARSTTWLTVPVGTIVEAIDLSMRGTSDFDQAIKDCDREILIAIVGAHLQILEGQTSGARGNTKVHKETSELIQWFLAASLADVYREQMAAPLIAENFAGVEVPDVSVGAITEEAMVESLKVDDGLQKLGWKLSRRDLGKRYARPWPEPDDALEAPAPAPPQQPPGPAGGGPDGANPFSERVRRFCMEGENKGQPGPCPEGKQAGTMARPFHAVGGVVAKGSYGGAAKILNGLRAGDYDSADAAEDLALKRDAARAGAVRDLARRYQGAQKLLVTERGPEALKTPEWQAVRAAFQSARDEIGGHIEALFGHAIDETGYHAAQAAAGEPIRIPASAREGIADAHNAIVDAYDTHAQKLDAALGGLRLKAHGFAEQFRRFCQDGENKGMPGPCPEGGKGKTGRDKRAPKAAPPPAATPAPTQAVDEHQALQAAADVFSVLERHPYELPTVPALVDGMKAKVPGLTTQAAHQLLLKWQGEDLLTLGVHNNPDADPRGREGIPSERGYLHFPEVNREAVARRLAR